MFFAGADAHGRARKATLRRAPSRARRSPTAVADPAQVRTHHARKPGDVGLASAKGAEAARGRVLGTLTRLGAALLGSGEARELTAPLSAGATDTTDARGEVARVLLERGALP